MVKYVNAHNFTDISKRVAENKAKAKAVNTEGVILNVIRKPNCDPELFYICCCMLKYLNLGGKYF